MTTYAFPSITPTESQISYLTNVQRFVSPISGAVQTVDRSGERLQIRMVFRNLSAADRSELFGFLTLLNGSQHRFTLSNHAEVQQGSFGGTPLVAGANQLGTTLAIDGCTASVTDWIKRGDTFGVNGEMKIATADSDSDGSGNVTLQFRPRLRSAPSDNAAITTSSATGLFMLGDDTVSMSNRPLFSDIVITAVEDIGA